MTKLLKIEKIIFGALIFSFFLQARLIVHSFRPQFNEWTCAYLYLTDILILVIIFLWTLRSLIKREPFVGKVFFGWPPHQNTIGANSEINRKFLTGSHFKSVINYWCGGWSGVFLMIFLLVVAVSLAVTSKFWLSFYGFLKLVELGALFLYVKNNFSKFFNLEWFWRIFIASSLLQSVVAIIQFSIQKSIGLKHIESPLSPGLAGVAKIIVNGKNYIRAYGLVPHPNILAAILTSAIFGLAYLFIKNYAVIGKGQKIIYAASLVFISTALFFTFSRAVSVVGFLVLLLWAAIIFFLPRRQAGWQKDYRRPVVIFIVVLFIANCLLLIAWWPFVAARYDVQSLGQSQALNLRVFYNKIAFDFIKGSPIFGIGQSNFVWSFSNLGLLPVWAYQPVHNIYLLIAAETGLLGLLAFLAFLFFTLKSAWSRRSDLAVTCLLSLVACLLIFGSFDHFLWDLQQGQIIFWLFLGILASFNFGLRSSTDRT